MQAGATMSKRGKPETKISTPKAKLDGPTPEQLRNNPFGRRFTMHVESATEAMTHVSRHDPIERWKAAERLSDGQIAAIDVCNRIWELIGVRQKTTSTYGERLGGNSGIEHRALSKIEAMQDLKRIEGYFPGPLRAWFTIFENVCRHGMAAGIAGGDDRNGAHTAYTTVCFVADYIAMKERL